MNNRGVSEIMGYIIVFSMVVATVAIVSTVGVGQIEDVRESEQMNNVEKAFDLYATNVNDIAFRGAPSRSTEMQLDAGQLEIANPVVVSFRGIDADNPAANNFSESYEVWPVTFTGPDRNREVVYAGGAVFRTNRGSGTMVTAPQIVARNGRVQIPLIHTRSRTAQSLGGGTARIRSEHARSVLLASDTESTYEQFFFNVSSARAGIWEDALDEYEAFDCRLDESGGRNRAVCRVDDPDRLHVVLVQIDVSLSD